MSDVVSVKAARQRNSTISKSVILQSSHKQAGWHNKEQKRCVLRNSLDVSRTPKEKRDEDGDESHGGGGDW